MNEKTVLKIFREESYWKEKEESWFWHQYADKLSSSQ